MIRAATLDSRSERMLELLAQGASARVIAKKLGYSEGTVRVYLHNLYRVIGVRNKTEAVIWHLGRTRQAAMPPPAAPAPQTEMSAHATESGSAFGDMALSEDLYTALGVMGTFLGPYGYLWEAGLRMKGTPIDERMVAARAQSRLLWRALLKGDCAYAKMLCDDGIDEHVIADSASDAVLLVSLLLVGGYSNAAQRVLGRVEGKHRMGTALSARESSLLRAVADAVERNAEPAIATLHEAAMEGTGSRSPSLRQAAMAVLFHLYRMHKQHDRARQVADAIWVEAESARRQLEAMGTRPLVREAAMPRAPARTKEAPPANAKLATTR